jgi:hypothetical protein
MIMAYFQNGTASECLDRTCQTCLLGSTRCPVYMIQNLFNFEQVIKGKEVIMRFLHFLIDDDGNCQVKKLIEDRLKEISPFIERADDQNGIEFCP